MVAWLLGCLVAQGLKYGFIKCPVFFFSHGVNTKVVDIGLVDLNMENEQNLMKQTRETGQKPHFGPVWPGTFSKI